MSKDTQKFSLPYIGSTGLYFQYNAQWKSVMKKEIKEELREELKTEILQELKEILRNGEFCEIFTDWEQIKIDDTYCK